MAEKTRKIDRTGEKWGSDCATSYIQPLALLRLLPPAVLAAHILEGGVLKQL